MHSPKWQSCSNNLLTETDGQCLKRFHVDGSTEKVSQLRFSRRRMLPSMLSRLVAFDSYFRMEAVDRHSLKKIHSDRRSTPEITDDCPFSRWQLPPSRISEFIAFYALSA
jgi:hypothetical protein